jgi:hypothetical protein
VLAGVCSFNETALVQSPMSTRLMSLLIGASGHKAIHGLLFHWPSKDAVQDNPDLRDSVFLVEKYPDWDVNLMNNMTNGTGFVVLKRVPILESQAKVYTKNSDVRWNVTEHCRRYESRSIRIATCIQDWGDHQNITAFRKPISMAGL